MANEGNDHLTIAVAEEIDKAFGGWQLPPMIELQVWFSLWSDDKDFDTRIHRDKSSVFFVQTTNNCDTSNVNESTIEIKMCNKYRLFLWHVGSG